MFSVTGLSSMPELYLNDIAIGRDTDRRSPSTVWPISSEVASTVRVVPFTSNTAVFRMSLANSARMLSRALFAATPSGTHPPQRASAARSSAAGSTRRRWRQLSSASRWWKGIPPAARRRTLFATGATPITPAAMKAQLAISSEGKNLNRPGRRQQKRCADHQPSLGDVMPGLGSIRRVVMASAVALIASRTACIVG